ncbi:hypothetical protein BDEG_23038 [Batrachochytrium dendrobatidis JEL423]|uniref:Uncharacterized protein n=1 Tax=Batrachochytrium dendrobatidis (strain JEL423) TaxID=403673 RepID=A0A177WII9_BATDL|nr:hypothetical protein BDEG_23038 [Batrachochytrium dendrobatidis JEL423]
MPWFELSRALHYRDISDISDISDLNQISSSASMDAFGIDGMEVFESGNDLTTQLNPYIIRCANVIPYPARNMHSVSNEINVPYGDPSQRFSPMTSSKIWMVQHTLTWSVEFGQYVDSSTIGAALM